MGEDHRQDIPLRRVCLPVTFAVLSAICPWVTARTTTTGELERLQKELEDIRERLEELEAGGIADASPGAERAEADPVSETAEPAIHIGGALRFNVIYQDTVKASRGKRGESGLDLFRLNVDGEIDNVLISAEYRYYPYMQTIHHGWIGYEFDDASQIQLGIHQVPFGLLPYAAHNSWFGVPYYVGLGDDYDMGIKYLRKDGAWSSQWAFYKNEELNNASDLGRYGFDLVRADEHQNEEVNRANGRLAYTFGAGTGCESELGASAQLAEIYNSTVGTRGNHWAAAAHLDSRCGRWNLQLEAARYVYEPPNVPGADLRHVRMGAFEGSYQVASKGRLLVANLAYNFTPPWRAVDQLICYNDYSRLFKDADFRDSRINTLGCALGSGPLFVYFDYILANNMAYFGAGSMAGGGEDEWHSRLNINIGYYW